ncbi:Alpha/Beta hydrolase protein [Aspergillus karnatakaensis]|uniref:alpha/beta fold hydrolase n=1 Tax=Aspergillus karnatakaensis TaxID=1810916 RepID=UPI003CCD766E
MKLLHKLLSLTLFVSATLACNCVEFELPIHVSATLPKFNVPEFTSSYDSTAFLIGSVSRSVDPTALAGGQAKVDRSFNIHFQYCQPKEEKHQKDVLQILSHGLGFDKSYWRIGNKETDYIAAATAAGYSVLNYDRLGVGRSEQADPYFEVQLRTQVAILARITELILSGHLSRKIPVPKKVVHVGHSYGSLITNGLVAGQPHLSDGIVLTGFSHDSSWTTTLELCLGFEVARFNNAARFKHYQTGYLTWGREFDNQCIFFKHPFFETKLLKQSEAIKAPFAIAELLSFTSVSLAAANFTKPVLMISGQADLPFCGGECNGILNGNESQSPFVFPSANPFVTYVHPNAGHGLNLHHNASAAYGVIHLFLAGNGL